MMQSYRYSTKVSAKTYVEINQKAPKWQIGTLVNIFITKLRDHQTYHINSMVLRVRKNWRRRTIRRQRPENILSHAKHHYVFRHIICHVHRKINAKRSHYGSFFARLAKVKLTLLEISKSHLFLHITVNQPFTSKSTISNQLISYKTSSDSPVFSFLFIPPQFLTFELTLLSSPFQTINNYIIYNIILYI